MGVAGPGMSATLHENRGKFEGGGEYPPLAAASLRIEVDHAESFETSASGSANHLVTGLSGGTSRKSVGAEV